MRRELRKDLKHDELVDTTVRAIQKIQEGPRPYVIGVALVLVVLLGGWGLFSVMESRRDAAAARFSSALATLDARVDTSTASAAASEFAPIFSTFDERQRAAHARLDEAAGAGGTSGGLATFLKGVVLLQEGDADAALELLESAEQQFGVDPSLGGVVRAALARAYQSAGRFDAAAEIWRGLAEGSEAYPRAWVLEGLGRALESTGDLDGARTAYEEILSQFPASPVARNAQQATNRLGG